MYAKPPTSPIAPPKPDGDGLEESRFWKWFGRLGDFFGIGAVVILFIVGYSRLRLAGAIPLPDVPADAGQLERIEVLAERASAIAMANQHLVEMIFCFAAAGVFFFLTVKLDALFLDTKMLKRENANLQKRIREYQTRETQRQIQEIEHEIAEMDEDRSEPRDERLAFLASIFGPNAPHHYSPFDDPDDDDDDDFLPPFPPGTKPHLN